MNWLASVGTWLSDAADGFVIMYNDGYLDDWLLCIIALLAGIALGWGMRSGIVYEHEEDE